MRPREWASGWTYGSISKCPQRSLEACQSKNIPIYPNMSNSFSIVLLLLSNFQEIKAYWIVVISVYYTKRMGDGTSMVVRAASVRRWSFPRLPRTRGMMPLSWLMFTSILILQSPKGDSNDQLPQSLWRTRRKWWHLHFLVELSMRLKMSVWFPRLPSIQLKGDLHKLNCKKVV